MPVRQLAEEVPQHPKEEIFTLGYPFVLAASTAFRPSKVMVLEDMMCFLSLLIMERGILEGREV